MTVGILKLRDLDGSKRSDRSNFFSHFPDVANLFSGKNVVPYRLRTTERFGSVCGSRVLLVGLVYCGNTPMKVASVIYKIAVGKRSTSSLTL
jgi:hypothetical protein